MGNLHSLTLDLTAVVKTIIPLLGEPCREMLRSRGGHSPGAAIGGAMGAGAPAAAAPEPGADSGDLGPAQRFVSI